MVVPDLRPGCRPCFLRLALENANVNAAEIDIANNDDDYALLFEKLQTIKKGRHYLNPLPF